MPLNETTVDTLRQLGILSNIRDMVFADTPDRMEGLRQAVTDGDRETVRTSAHRLAGTMAQVGADQLAAALRNLETSQPADHRARLGEVEALWAVVAEELRAL